MIYFHVCWNMFKQRLHPYTSLNILRQIIIHSKPHYRQVRRRLLHRVQHSQNFVKYFNIFKCIFFFHYCIYIQIWLVLLTSSWVQVMAWCRTGDKPLPDLMVTQFTDAYWHHQSLNEINTTSIWWPNIIPPCTVKCHYNACHYNANASLTRSILGSQIAPTSWHALMTVPEWLSTWAKGVKSSRSDRPQRQWHLFVPIQLEQNKRIPPAGHVNTVDSWLIFDQTHWLFISAARRPDVENNPGSNQVNISHTHVN